eukprot:6320200-Pyramimonas_sp.AAC.1
MPGPAGVPGGLWSSGGHQSGSQRQHHRGHVWVYVPGTVPRGGHPGCVRSDTIVALRMRPCGSSLRQRRQAS